MIVAVAVFTMFAGALLTTWIALQTAATNVTSYAKRQNDQMRVVDYLKRDIRRASSVSIYNGAALVTGTSSGSELRITIPDYYADAREEDNAIGTRVANTPALTDGAVTYGSTTTLRYYVLAGAVIRQEGGTSRTVAGASGAFTTSFRKETTGEIRCEVFYDQPLRGGPRTRTLRRQLNALCGLRSDLQL